MKEPPLPALTGLRLRTARVDDAEQIAALHTASWRNAYAGALSAAYLASEIVAERRALWLSRFGCAPPGQFVVVAEVANEIVGFVCAYAAADAQWGTLLDNIHVAPGLQGRKIGTRLLGATAQWCASTTAVSGLFLWVLQHNPHAHRFYEALGALRAGADTWTPPGGGALARYRYAWSDVERLSRELSERIASGR